MLFRSPAAQAESAEPAAAAGLKRVVMAGTAVPAVPAGHYTAAAARAAVVVTVEPLTASRVAVVVTAVTAGLLDWPAMAEPAVQAVTPEGGPPMTGLPVPVVPAGGSSASPGRRDKPGGLPLTVVCGMARLDVSHMCKPPTNRICRLHMSPPI